MKVNHKRSDTPDISIPPVQSPVRTPTPAPAPAPISTPTPIAVPQLPPPSSPNPGTDSSARPASPSVKYGASLDSPTLSTPKITGSNDSPAKTAGDGDGTQRVMGGGRKKKGLRSRNTLRGPSGKDMASPAVKNVVPPPDKDVVPPAVKQVVPLADKDMDPPQSEVIVQLVCGICEVKQPRNNLSFDLYCNFCSRWSAVMKCVSCGTTRSRDTETCTNCRGRFE